MSRLLWTDEVAELAGVKPRSITTYLKDSKRAHEQGTVTAAHIPLPVDHVNRTVPTSVPGVMRTTPPAPRWDEEDIRAWLARRPSVRVEAGRRQAGRIPRDETGHFTKAAS